MLATLSPIVSIVGWATSEGAARIQYRIILNQHNIYLWCLSNYVSMYIHVATSVCYKASGVQHYDDISLNSMFVVGVWLTCLFSSTTNYSWDWSRSNTSACWQWHTDGLIRSESSDDVIIHRWIKVDWNNTPVLVINIESVLCDDTIGSFGDWPRNWHVERTVERYVNSVWRTTRSCKRIMYNGGIKLWHCIS